MGCHEQLKCRYDWEMNHSKACALTLLLGVVACGSTKNDGSAGTGGASAGSGNPGNDAGTTTLMGGASATGGVGAGGTTGGVGVVGTAGTLPTGRSFVDTNETIAILADQLPQMSSSQMAFATSHYVGTEKQLLPVTRALRALNPNFLVLHYHLSMWQSAPTTNFIIDGTSWGNDYPTVTTNESWFWHNTANQRVPSNADGKLLMNISVPGFQQYWEQSLAAQVKAGDYDAIFLDSASPALLQGECSGGDPRLAGTAARDTQFAELGDSNWINAWQAWITGLDAALAAQGIPLIPNTSAFVTGWDNTNYSLTAGAFVEGFSDRGFVESDWKASTNELLKLAAADKILILQNYLSNSTDVATRLYYLGNYLLVKGHHTYLEYFAGGPLEWYPEWEIQLGAPRSSATEVSELLSGGVYRRDFAQGSVLVNPSPTAVTVDLGGTYQRVVPSGGGAVDTSGVAPGSLSMQAVTTLNVAATSAEIVLD